MRISRPSVPVLTYNMFFDHAVYSKLEQLQYMAADTAFVTQIRHPLTHLTSILKHFNYKGGAETFLQDAQRQDITFASQSCYPANTTIKVTKNLMTFTLGYMKADDNDVGDFTTYLSKLVDELQFVSILEQKLESMLLLKRKLCWSIKDVLHIHTHKRFLHDSNSRVNKTLEGMHRMHSPLDYLLYQQFETKLRAEISSQDSSFKEELEEYRTLQENFTSLCRQLCYDVDGITEVKTVQSILSKDTTIRPTKHNPEFSLSYTDCLWAMAPEYVVKVMLKIKQYPGACTALMGEIGLEPIDCDFKNHVYPGYHINTFRSFFSNRKACLDNTYNDL